MSDERDLCRRATTLWRRTGRGVDVLSVDNVVAHRGCFRSGSGATKALADGRMIECKVHGRYRIGAGRSRREWIGSEKVLATAVGVTKKSELKYRGRWVCGSTCNKSGNEEWSTDSGRVGGEMYGCMKNNIYASCVMDGRQGWADSMWRGGGTSVVNSS